MPNQAKFDLTIDNFYSLQPDTAFAKPKATVTLYIDNEKIYFKKFDGMIVKGKQKPNVIVKQGETEVADAKVFYVDAPVGLTIESENFSDIGLESRIEMDQKVLDQTNTSTIIFTIPTPVKNDGANVKNIDLASPSISSNSSKQHIIKGKTYYRLKDNSGEKNWLESSSFIRQYSLIDNTSPINGGLKFSSIKFIIDNNKNVSFKYRIIDFTNVDYFLVRNGVDTMGYLDLRPSSANRYQDGSNANTLTYRRTIVDSLNFGNNNQPIQTNRFYIFKLQGIKRIITFIRLQYLFRYSSGIENVIVINFVKLN